MVKKCLFFVLAAILLFDNFEIGQSVFFAVPRKLTPEEKEKAKIDEADLELARMTLPKLVKSRQNLDFAKQHVLKFFPITLRMNKRDYGIEMPSWTVEKLFKKASDVFGHTVYALCTKDAAGLETKFKQKDLDISRLMIVANKNSNKRVEVYSC